MHQFVSLLSRSELLARQVPIAGTSLVIAELFYRFHSFALETAAFLTTWYALDALVSVYRRPHSPSRPRAPARRM